MIGERGDHPQILEIRMRIDSIRSVAATGDHEAAHSMEDRLFVDVLQLIKNRPARRDGAPSARVLAAEVLLSREVGFNRCTA